VKHLLIETAAVAMALLAAAAACGDTPPPAPYGATPSSRQMRWHAVETYAFLHFTVNTFTDKEWGYGDEDPNIFHPTQFDADQIVSALKAGGMKGVILTAKHHDGFCLWPTKTTEHSVAKSKWKGGKGDVVKEIADACRRQGLKFGVYLSPWDRNNPNYGKPEYVALYRQQLRELLSNYGPLFEVWHDGANGGDGFYGGARETRSIDKKTYYQWQETWNMIRRLQPNAVVFSDVGPDIRWVGNERGVAGDPCWATLSPEGYAPGESVPHLNSGLRGGTRWLPAECDVSIRPGWFWHESENSRVKSPRQLLDLYYQSVGRGAGFLLNVPPNRQGRLHADDVASLKHFGEILRATFRTNLAAKAEWMASNVRGNDPAYGPKSLQGRRKDAYWATDDGVTTAELTADLHKETTFNVIRLREYLPLGQRIEGFAVDAWKEGGWQEIAASTSLGSCRLIRLTAPVTTGKVRLRITKSPVCIALSEFGLFLEPTQE
jgi:alpha-L-fucosidase